MSKKESPVLESRVLEIFKPNPDKHFTFKQLQKRLKDTKKEQLHNAVQELIKKGVLEETPHRKYKKVKAAKEDRKKASAPVSSGKKENLVEGVVDLTLSGSAYIISPELPQDIYIPNKFVNKAFDGDKVKVRIKKNKKGRPEGEIVEVVSRAREEFVGTLEIAKDFGFVIPDKRHIPVDIFIPANNIKDVAHGDRVIAKIVNWPKDKKNPEGEIVERLGSVGNNNAEMLTILVDNGFPLHFPKNVINEVENLHVDITTEEIARRHDYRDVTTFTIDPDDAKDFDDAISIRPLEKKGKEGQLWEVGIHIADVAHYVKPGTALDKEAYKRATSVYLVDRVLPMLPERLSNMVCSLRPNEDKLCFSAVFVMDDNATIKKSWFGRTVINSNHRFTYDQAQEIIETGEGPFSEEIKVLNDLSHKLRKDKFKNGAIAFETVEVKFHIDLDGVPLGVYVKERKEAHMLVEDFMLLANKEVAKFVSMLGGTNTTNPFVYRVHDKPDPEKLEDFSAFARKFGYDVKIDTPDQVRESLNRLMKEIKGKPEQDLLEQLAIRSMAKAVYTTKNLGHYGLAFDYYTHFTSPIRRYPDVMVHRLLNKYLNKDFKKEKGDLEEYCTHCSWMERKAMDAERESVKYKQVEFLENKVGEVYEGIVSGVVNFGLFVEIVENRCEGLVHTESMEEDYFTFDEKNNQLKGTDTGITYRLGDKVTIRIIRTDLEKRQIDFELANEESDDIEKYFGSD